MGFFSKLFGGKSSAETDVEALVKETLLGIIENGGFALEFTTKSEKIGDDSVLQIELSGDDEELLKDRKGELLDAIQLFLKRTAQHNFPEDRTLVNVDCGGYREESEAALIERADNLKTICIEQGKSVYYRALPPKERKIVHQHLSKDPRVKSRSLGDGLYKKIKIYPAKAVAGQEESTQN